MLIYTEKISPRLQYIAEVFFGECSVTTSAIIFHEAQVTKINYSHKRFSENEFHITPSGLLSENGIKNQPVTISTWKDLPVFFSSRGDIPFDIFSASFYLLSRYEEYLPHEKDAYGRFAHTESLAYRSGFLSLPLVNLWTQHFFSLLQQRFHGYIVPQREFSFVPTYDIDIAFAEGRGWIRKIAKLVKGEKTRINGRDIFDVYDWLNDLHENYNLSPVYFFLLAKRRSKYDKNLSPKSKKLQGLVENLSAKYNTGLHPSWQSYHDEQDLRSEASVLEKITKKNVSCSRQHYVQFTLPVTYRNLLEAGIAEDYSMGYGSINGFRASYAAPFFWYDLMREEKTTLLLHPFCFMDANAHFEEKLSAAEAGKSLQYYFETVKHVQGEFITIFHNHFLTEEPQWQSWRKLYQDFLEANFDLEKNVTSLFPPEQ